MRKGRGKRERLVLRRTEEPVAIRFFSWNALTEKNVGKILENSGTRTANDVIRSELPNREHRLAARCK
jgi:hypothetical protein